MASFAVPVEAAEDPSTRIFASLKVLESLIATLGSADLKAASKPILQTLKTSVKTLTEQNGIPTIDRPKLKPSAPEPPSKDNHAQDRREGDYTPVSSKITAPELQKHLGLEDKDKWQAARVLNSRGYTDL